MFVARDRIPVAGPSITDREVELCAEASRTAWYENHNVYNARFERMLAEYVGVAYAVSLPHCTAALHLALAALGIGPGDEVIGPDVTWIASMAPVTYVGAEPVLVDILPDTWCIDPNAVEAAIGPATKAIIGVDLYGSVCDWERLEAIAARHGLFLIEDAAEALGSQLKARKAGAFGSVSTFSFHGSKTVTTGEGGMLATNDAELFDRVLRLRDHGRKPGDRFFLNEEIAFKYRMSAVQAALGVAQMERIDALIAQKRAIFGWYRERFGDTLGIVLNAEPEGVTNSYWMVTAVPDAGLGLDKFDLMAGLEKRNIDSRPFFSRLSTLRAFQGRERVKRFVAPGDKGVHASTCGVNLPSGYNMSEDLVDIVCRAFRDVLAKRL
ncbi:MAG: glutamine--scyllo-inositol aminotransferase [Beijerinckiaceae bacterium]|jgi:perosamine synthetase|nr:MAG: glutamine--scyllo-inositol aminotransferase [Beijerinckiaceae bacterium]